MRESQVKIAIPDTRRAARDMGYMREALRLARAAAVGGEIPVGAVLAFEGRILAGGFNRSIGASDPTAHAEIVAIREAAARIGNYRLTGAELVVTLEPCLMCFGAAIHARIGRVVFGAPDPRLGAAALVQGLQRMPGILNHRLAIDGGIAAEECATLLSEFFAERRREARGGAHTGQESTVGEVPKWS